LFHEGAQNFKLINLIILAEWVADFLAIMRFLGWPRKTGAKALAEKRGEQHGQDKHRRGPSTPRHQALCHTINL